MTRALVVTTSFPRHSADPAGSFVAAHAQALHRAGAEVCVLAPPGAWAPPGVRRVAWRPAPGILDQGGAPDVLERRPGRAAVAGAVSTVSLLASAVRHASAGAVVVGHWLVPCGLAALAAGRRTGAPVRLYAHGGDVALLARMPGGRALARRLDAGAELCFVSDALRARFAALLPGPPRRPHRVLPMGVAAPRPDAGWVRRLTALAAGRRVVATVGRMTRIKGLDVLAEALAGRRDVVWLAAGDGPARAAVAARCRRLGVAFEALGMLGPSARDALLAVADVFALPSREIGGRTEGMPVALLEAMVSGVPGVASDTGGVAAAAQGAGVLLVPPDDRGALARAMARVLDEPGLGAQLAARNRVAGDRFRWSTLGPQHAAWVCEQRGGSAHRRR